MEGVSLKWWGYHWAYYSPLFSHTKSQLDLAASKRLHSFYKSSNTLKRFNLLYHQEILQPLRSRLAHLTLQLLVHVSSSHGLRGKISKRLMPQICLNHTL
jgi:hypothetical protein